MLINFMYKWVFDFKLFCFLVLKSNIASSKAWFVEAESNFRRMYPIPI